MTIPEVLDALQSDVPIVVGDKTFEPRGLDEVTLETGESVYWAHEKNGAWLSIDPASDEIILFEDLDEELEPEDDTVVYGGEDYEFSYEGTATIKSEDGEETTMIFREYESPDGDLLRITEEETTGDVRISLGTKLTEDELQSA